VTNRAVFTGKDVEGCYDTRQVFLENYPHGSHSVLSPWHTVGRFAAPEKLPFWSSFFRALVGRPLPRPSPVRRPVVRDPVAVRAALLAKRLPADRRLAFIRRYLAACPS
jgi:hypothetical protein